MVRCSASHEGPEAPGAGYKAHGLRRRPADKLSRIRPIAHDDDERPTREDLRFGETLLSRTPVPLPRMFRAAEAQP